MTLDKTNTGSGHSEPRPSVKQAERIATVRLDGIVERAGIEACDYALMTAGDSITGAVIDLSLATHIDYRAAVILVARRRVLKARGGELAVAAARSDVRHILRAVAGMEIPIFPSVAEATNYVRGEPMAEYATAAVGRARSKPRTPKAPGGR